MKNWLCQQIATLGVSFVCRVTWGFKKYLYLFFYITFLVDIAAILANSKQC